MTPSTIFSRAAQAHPLYHPLTQKGDRTPSAGIERHAHGRRHQHAPRLISAEGRRDGILGHIALEQGGEQHPEKEIQPRRPHVAPEVFQIAHQQVRIRVVAFSLRKADEVEERPVPVKEMNRQSRHAAAQKAGHDTYCQGRGTQRGAVDDELRIEQNGGHHERRQPVVPHPLPGEGRGNGDRSVHTQRACDTQNAGGDDAEHAPSPAVDFPEGGVNLVFREHGDQGADGHADDPVPEDLRQLDLKIIPEIDQLPFQDIPDHSHFIISRASHQAKWKIRSTLPWAIFSLSSASIGYCSRNEPAFSVLGTKG